MKIFIPFNHKKISLLKVSKKYNILKLLFIIFHLYGLFSTFLTKVKSYYILIKLFPFSKYTSI